MKYLKKYNEEIDIEKYLSSDGKRLNLNSLSLTQLPKLPKLYEKI
jgi:hypothetical protein